MNQDFPCSPCRHAWLAVLALLVTSSVAIGNPYLESPVPEFRYDDSGDVPWLEEQTEIPPPPEVSDLQFLQIEGLPPGLELHLDTARVVVNPKDQVIRLWVYLLSDQGAKNGTYEGFRCGTGLYKVYGYATPRRTPPVTRAKRTEWRIAEHRPGSLHRRILMDSYLCGLRGPRPLAEIQQAVRYGSPHDPMLDR